AGASFVVPTACTKVTGTAAATTVRGVDPEIEPETAVMVVEPTAAAVARPALLMVATAVADELQLTNVVRFCVLPSLYLPVALHCCMVPATIEGLAGVTASEGNVGGVTGTAADGVAPSVAVKVRV